MIELKDQLHTTPFINRVVNKSLSKFKHNLIESVSGLTVWDSSYLFYGVSPLGQVSWRVEGTQNLITNLDARSDWTSISRWSRYQPEHTVNETRSIYIVYYTMSIIRFITYICIHHMYIPNIRKLFDALQPNTDSEGVSSAK